MDTTWHVCQGVFDPDAPHPDLSDVPLTTTLLSADAPDICTFNWEHENISVTLCIDVNKLTVAFHHTISGTDMGVIPGILDQFFIVYFRVEGFRGKLQYRRGSGSKIWVLFYRTPTADVEGSRAEYFIGKLE